MNHLLIICRKQHHMMANVGLSHMLVLLTLLHCYKHVHVYAMDVLCWMLLWITSLTLLVCVQYTHYMQILDMQVVPTVTIIHDMGGTYITYVQCTGITLYPLCNCIYRGAKYIGTVGICWHKIVHNRNVYVMYVPICRFTCVRTYHGPDSGTYIYVVQVLTCGICIIGR